MTQIDAIQTFGGKCGAIRWLGRTGGKETVAQLIEIVNSKKKAQEFLSKWINGPLHEASWGQQDLIVKARGAAALGLIFSQNDEGIACVEKQYASMKLHIDGFDEEMAKMMNDEERENLRISATFLHLLKWALVYSAYIDDNGVAAYLNIGSMSTQERANTIGKYQNIYE
jgi:hypothetical protein